LRLPLALGGSIGADDARLEPQRGRDVTPRSPRRRPLRLLLATSIPAGTGRSPERGPQHAQRLNDSALRLSSAPARPVDAGRPRFSCLRRRRLSLSIAG